MDATLTIRLDAETARALADAAQRTNRSRGQIVREALAEHLRSSPTSALEGLAKYAGLMKGAADLSTNKRHLKGLGKRRR
jgi:predicted transcriptional regulator